MGGQLDKSTCDAAIAAAMDVDRHIMTQVPFDRKRTFVGGFETTIRSEEC